LTSDDVQALIEATGLCKRFGRRVAVDGIDFSVQSGEAFGLLGPNGAGKTTTMRMISCVSPRSGGSLRILGLDPDTDGPTIRARLGVVPQRDALDRELTVLENLLIYARYFDIPWRAAKNRAQELLDFVRLLDRADEGVDGLSGGMKRRLVIARALINDPDVIILDEPTTGLDPQARHLIWDRLYALKQRGVTLLLTTHYMDEAEQLCDRIVIMDGGRIIAEDSPAVLIREHCTREVVELRFAVGQRPDVDGQFGDLADWTEQLPDRVLLYTDDGDALCARMASNGCRPENTVVRRGNLEDVFLRLTGRELVR
jgi:lipooligosaccharide transport system ATP-binding protein